MRTTAVLVVLLAACSSLNPPAEPAARGPGGRSSAAAKKAPWGAPVPSPGAEAHVRDGLHALASGADPLAHMSDTLVIGPALWSALKNSGMPDKGLVTELHIPGVEETFEGRSFGDDKPGRRLADIVGSDALRAAAAYFDGTAPRPATDRERQIVYQLIPFEIAGQPMTVVEARDRRLAVLHDEQGEIFWLELLSSWY